MTRAKPNLEAWLTKSQVAEALQVSEKTVERMAARHQLTQGTRARVGKPPVAVYAPADVEQMKARLESERSLVVPAIVTSAPASLSPAERSTAIQLRSQAPAADALRDLLGQAGAVPLWRKLYLSVHEAAALSGLTQRAIREAIAAGKLRTQPYGGGVRVSRIDLEQL